MPIKALGKVSEIVDGSFNGRIRTSFVFSFFITEIGWKPPERGRWKSSYQILSGNAGSTPAPSTLIGGIKI